MIQLSSFYSLLGHVIYTHQNKSYTCCGGSNKFCLNTIQWSSIDLTLAVLE